MRMFKSLLTLLVMTLILSMASNASACPNCKEAVANQEGSDAEGLKTGYSWSIIMMISAPFSMLSVGAFAVVRAVKRGSLPEM